MRKFELRQSWQRDFWVKIQQKYTFNSLFLSFLLYLQNKMHINDWQSIQTLWDKLTKQVEKTQKVTGALGTPRAYVKIMVELEDFLNKTLAGESLIELFWVSTCLDTAKVMRC